MYKILVLYIVVVSVYNYNYKAVILIQKEDHEKICEWQAYLGVSASFPDQDLTVISTQFADFIKPNFTDWENTATLPQIKVIGLSQSSCLVQ